MSILSRMTGATFVAVLWLAAPAAHADAVYDKCNNAAVSNVDFGACGAAYMKRADVALNAAWKQVFAMVSGQSRTDLLAEQRAWIAYKEASCKFYANGDYGREGQVISFPACRAGVLEERAKDLRDLAKSLKQP